MTYEIGRGVIPPVAQLIAVIDDDQRVLESLETLLQSSGYRTFLSSSAEQFLRAPERAQVSVLISDIGLPGMSGVELLREMQRNSQEVPTILITGRGEAGLEEDARSLGVLRFFNKPFDTLKLLAALEDRLQGPGCARIASSPCR